jgi:hypothetical protein
LLIDSGVGQSSADGTSVTFAKVDFTMGDIHLTADHCLIRTTNGMVDPVPHIEATGHVVLTRGDETFRGSSFVLDIEGATLVGEDATFVSPPLYVHAAHLDSGADQTVATDAQLAIGTTDGRGEMQARAEQAVIDPGKTLQMRNVAISLYGLRLFTLRRLTISLQSTPRSLNESGSMAIPIIVRNSQISGPAFGLDHAFELYRKTFAQATVVETAKQGVEYLLTVRHTLAHRDARQGRHRLRLAKTDAASKASADPNAPAPDSIREFLKARPLPPKPDAVLDFTDIASTPDPLSIPARSASADLNIAVNVSRRQEIGFQRQGLLLLSRSPELILSGTLPLTATAIGDDNAEARAALRQPRLALTGQAVAGSLSELRLFDSDQTIHQNRLGVVGGLTTLPLLIGSHVLFQAQSNLHIYHYEDGDSYHYLETSVNSDYVFGERSALGASYIVRSQKGETPFDFDQVDTQDEAQVRGETSIGTHHRYTVAAVGRYDVSQRRFFDYELALAIRGHNIEPRISYRHLNKQIGFGISLPGILGP